MASKNGIAIDKFAEEVERTSMDLFLKRWTTPFLLVEAHSQGSKKVFSTGKVDVSAGKQQGDGESGEDSKSPGLVFPLRKTGRNTFMNMISVGRTSNNDIMLDNPCVSKLHAFFKPSADNSTFTISDSGSTSGTTIDGVPLAPNMAVPVESGQVLVFGGAVNSTFMSPKGIYEHIKSLKFFKKI